MNEHGVHEVLSKDEAENGQMQVMTPVLSAHTQHVPGSFDEFDGHTGEFIRSSGSGHFPLFTGKHHGTKGDTVSPP